MHRRCWKSEVLVACGLSIVCATPVLAANRTEDIHQLLVQGHFWYGQGQTELAIKAWRKVLRAEPGNREALFGIEEIRHFDPDAIDHEQLKRARSLALQGKYDEALKAYEAAFRGKKPPSSFHAAEYFETMGGVPKHWKQARLALEKLVKHYPSNTAYRLALARVESLNEKTRRQAIAHFESMSEESLDPASERKLLAAWKDALLWLHARRSDAPLYQHFLTRYPQSRFPQIRHRYAQLTIPIDETPEGAFALLEKGDLKHAARGFAAMLKKQPKRADALEGLGLVRLRQHRYREAERLLEQAIHADKRKEQSLRPAIDDARFWRRYHWANHLFDIGESKRARQIVENLLKERPEQMEVLLFRAQLASWNRDFGDAADYFERVLQKDPSNKTAQAGLIDAFINLGDDRKATTLLKKYHLPTDQYERARDHLKATRLRTRANLSQDPHQSETLLRQALALDADNPWLHLDLARTLVRLNRKTEARKVMELLRTLPDEDGSAHYALALFEAELANWPAVQAELSQIPESSRSYPMQRLLDQAQGELDYQQALTRLRAGDKPAARVLAERMQPLSARFPRIALHRADLLIRLGQREAGVEAAHQASHMLTHDADPGLWVRYADLLLKTQQWPEFDALVTRLLNTSTLDAAQTEAVAAMRLSAALTRARTWLARGQAEKALALLEPLKQDYSNNPDFKLALAAGLQGTHQDRKALTLFQDVLRRDPDSIDAAAGAFGAAMTLKQFRLAEQINQRALQRHPDHPRLLAGKARLALLRQQKAKARHDLEKALARADNAEDLPPHWRDRTRTLLDSVIDHRLPTAGTGLAIRTRGEQHGLDRLEERVLPVSLEIAKPRDGKLTLELRHLQLDSGQLSANQASQYGSLILSDSTPDTRGIEHRYSGFSPGIAYHSDNLSADLRLTPSTFPVRQAYGGLSWRHYDFGYQVSGTVSRRPVRESLLAYAGAIDPLTGHKWGGVSRTSAELGVVLPSETSTLYSRFSVARLTGKHVRDNAQLRLDGGLQWPLLSQDERQASIGLQLEYQDYQRNLDGFTLGQGGYFSPDDYLAIRIPFDWRQTRGPLSLSLNAAVGMQRYSRPISPVFPNDPALQRQLDDRATSDPNVVTSRPAAEKSSAVYTLRGEIGYSPDKRLALGAWASLTDTNNFKESAAGVFLRYFWNPVSSKEAFPGKKFETPEVW